jgi:ethanolamine utilization protein EutQ (cupin superfamily)
MSWCHPQIVQPCQELTRALARSCRSDHIDPEKPISCGFYRLEAGTPLVYTYTYHEMKIIVDGEFDISDETGQEVHAVAGDVFYFPKGSVITFKTKTFGLGFYCGQRKKDTA